MILNTISPPIPPHSLAGASPLPLDVGCLSLVGSNILLSMVVQQQVVILEFSQKMSACPSTLLSWRCSLKNDIMISVCFQGKPFNSTVIQVYAMTSNAEEAVVEWFYEDLQELLELIPQKDVLFIIVTGMQK